MSADQRTPAARPNASVAHQGVAATYYASLVLRSALDYLAELAERGVTLCALYSVATTADGEHLARKLGFDLHVTLYATPTPTDRHEQRRSAYGSLPRILLHRQLSTTDDE